MEERGIIIDDVLHILKNGFVYKEGEPSTREGEGFYRYKIQCKSPNSNNREIAIIAIPSSKDKTLKLVTVMWVDKI